jgi:peptide deformylase
VGEVEGQVKHDDGHLDAEAQARRRLALAQIRQFGDPVLRMQAQEVTEFDDDLRRLVDRMVSLMRDAQGVGLAGTQVGVLRRVFVFQADAEAEPQAVVNPLITERSQDVDTDDEGCLSLQGVLVPVERPSRLTLEGKTPAGEDLRLELEGLGARVVQHELDHLDGVLIIDRTDGEHRREALGILRPQPVLYVG